MELSIALIYLSCLVSAGVAVACYRRRATAGAIPLCLMMAALAAWSGVYAGELVASSASWRVALAYSKYLFITLVPVAWLFFALRYRDRSFLTSRFLMPFLLIVPFFSLIAVLTNGYHYLFFRAIQEYTHQGATLLIFTYGPLFWVHTIYSYLLILLGIVILLRDIFQLSRFYRRQGYLLLTAISMPILANILSVFRIIPHPYIDLTPIALSVTGILFAVAIFHFKLLDIMPIAREAVFRNLRDVVLILDRQLRLVDFNPAATGMLIKEGDGVIGQKIGDIFPEWQEVAERISTGVEFSQQIVLQPSTEEPVYYDLHVSPMWAGGNKAGYLLVLRDVTILETALKDLAQAKSLAEEANAMKGQFLANISHEIRTPLNAVLGFASRLADYLEGEREQDYLSGIIRGADNLMLLINDILDLSKIEAGKMEINPRPVNLAALLTDCRQIFSLKASEKDLALLFAEDSPTPPTLLLDDLRLRQILVNLIGNAVKFTEHGTVKVLSSWKGQGEAGMLHITVQDTGIGIPEEARKKIFAAFSQQDGETTRKYGGTGLGLAICRRLALMMGGSLELTSEVGKGSSFTLTIPAQRAAGNAEAYGEIKHKGIASIPGVYTAVDQAEIFKWRDLTAQEARAGFSGDEAALSLLLAYIGGGLDQAYLKSINSHYFDDIADFARQCEDIGAECHNGTLAEYGALLSRCCRAFDIQNMELLLHEYPAIIQRIREGLSHAG